MYFKTNMMQYDIFNPFPYGLFYQHGCTGGQICPPFDFVLKIVFFGFF